jgi:sirohydrochlorin cobaltochelatase
MRDLAVLFLGHGSREALANDEVRALAETFAAERPDCEVGHGFVELAAPYLAEALDALAMRARHVVVLPVMLFAAGHVKNDVPLALAAARLRHPGTRFSAARALGVDATLASLAFGQAAPFIDDAKTTTLVVVGRGSSDPDANGDFFKAARLVGEGRNLGHLEPCFMGITTPKVDEALERAVRQRPAKVVVLPYLLFPGRLLTRLDALVASLRERYPWVPIEVAPPLGRSDALYATLVERLDAALEGAAPLPCDTCQYRTPLEGFVQQVGGLKALLYSVRHGVTHSQAMPHEHAHRPLKKHVLVCINGDCADRGSIALAEGLRKELKVAGLSREVRVTKTSCMGRCGEGPTVVVYPDGVWYRGVRPEDARSLVAEHLAEERLVSRLVDNVMQ